MAKLTPWFKICLDSDGWLRMLGPLKIPLLLPSGRTEEFNLYLFRSGRGRYHVLEKGEVKRHSEESILVRIESACFFGHLYGSQLCDCKWQLDKSLEAISKSGLGILVYAIDQDCMGSGPENGMKVRMVEQAKGIDCLEARKMLGLKADERDYSDILEILKEFGIKRMRMLTNSPARLEFFKGKGMGIERIPLEANANAHNQKCLVTKKGKLGHLLSLRQKPQTSAKAE